MSRMTRTVSAALLALALGVPAASAAPPPIPAHVRVLAESERIMRWLGPDTDVLLVVNQGTTLAVLDFDQEQASYWVILPPDLHGTRKVGWIRASSVEPYVPPALSDPARSDSYAAAPASPGDLPRDSARVEAAAAP